MDTQTQAQIYLADQRGCSQVDYLRSFHSFNFGQYVAEGREPFGALQLLNDDVLKPGNSASMQVEANTLVVILPLVGGLEYKSSVDDGFLAVGEVLHLSLAAGMSYELINPYETELINYIAVWFDQSNTAFTPGTQVISFDLQTKNELLPLFDPSVATTAVRSSIDGFIGRFDGRSDGFYTVASPPIAVSRGVFVFILSGAFEVQNRLLHERDGLALADIQDNLIDFEALSNDALLLLLDVPLSSY